MKQVLFGSAMPPDCRIPIKLWADNIEPSAMEQIYNLAKLPFAFHHIAIMPDCHSGYGMPIGGVLACNNVVIPEAVGLDIGCGMCASRTNIKADIFDDKSIKLLCGSIRDVIPVGKVHQKYNQPECFLPSGLYFKHDGLPVISEEYDNATRQIGTLGGGNHFIEIQNDTSGMVWIMIHSGSRNIGKQVGQHYNKVAINLNEKWYSSVSKSLGLAFLPADSEQGKLYIEEMHWCMEFARLNRQLMMQRIKECIVCSPIVKNLGMDSATLFPYPNLDVIHNYASLENHFNKNVWVHRKGATLARKGETGIIPGTQKTPSYIVQGLGNVDSFRSCSHGAGRCMSRKKARETLNLEEERKEMEDAGIVCGMRHASDVEESWKAYKDIDAVMKNQEDLVDIVVELHPMAVVKE